MIGTAFVETSALLRALLEADQTVAGLLRTASILATSELTLVEADRALLRAFIVGRIDADERHRLERRVRSFSRAADVVRLDAGVLTRAGQAFPVEPVRTLDALHLASLLTYEASSARPSVVSCDERVRSNARALGFEVLP